MAKYVLYSQTGFTTTVTSERAAKAKAREWLGATRLTETPTENGWQYWAAGSDDDECITVVVS